MLTRLLALVAEGRLHTAADLAAALGVSRELVEAMLAELQRQGYLTPPPASCPGACGACPLQAGCCPVETSTGDIKVLAPRAHAGRPSR
jgi:DNA-binding transcriptional MocR family regulator